MLDKTIRKQLGYLLWRERANQEKEIRWVVKKMKTEISSVDFAEHGKGHMNWKFYERMLELYGKEVKITLIDKEEKTKTAG